MREAKAVQNYLTKKTKIMGASKNDFIEDSFFNAHYAEDGQHACGSFETEACIKACYVKRKPAQPPHVPFIPLSKEDSARWEYLKQTDEEKNLQQDQYLKTYGI